MSSITPTLQVDITISGSTTTEISGGCSQSQVGEIQIVGIQGGVGPAGQSPTGDISLLSGQIISLSGDLYFTGSNLLAKINTLSGNLYTTGDYLLSLINQINTNTGNFTGLFYPRNENPLGYLTSLSGSITGFNSGDYVLKSETGQFANKLDLIETGFNLNNKINSLSGDLLSSGNNLLNEINLIKNVTGVNLEAKGIIVITTGINNQFIISGISTDLLGYIKTGEADLRYYSINNPSGFITGIYSGDFATIQNLFSTGQTLNNYILSLSGDLIITGRFLDNKILSLSGDLLSSGSNLLNQINDIKTKTGINIIAGTNVSVITGINNEFTINSTASGSSAGLSNFGINFLINGNGSAISTGYKGFLVIPYDCNLTGWMVTADITGSIQYEILKNTFSSFTAQTGTVITFENEKPNLINQIKNQDLSLTGWITGLAKNDILSIRVDSATSLTLATLTLLGLK